MKVFFCLILFSLMLASCQGACLQSGFEAEIIDGAPVVPSTCLDKYDGTKHLIGSTWNTAHCLKCRCTKLGLGCCDRYVPTERQGCKTVVNYETCENEFYRLDDPSQRCED